MCETMKNLGFITNTEKLGGGLFERERTLLFALWWALKGEELGGVTSRNLCLFSLGILGLSYKLSKDPQKDGFSAKALPKDENRKNFDEEKEGMKLTKNLKHELLHEELNRGIKESNVEQEEPTLKPLSLGNIVQNTKDFYEQWAKLKQGRVYGRLDIQGNLELERKDIEEIHKKFQLFYRNRLSNEVLKKAPEQEKPTFEPNILENSKVLASTHREKLAEKTQEFLRNQALETKLPENGEFTHADLLILSKEANKFEQSKKLEVQSQDTLRECTFHPKILPSAEKSTEKSDRNLELFNLSKNKMKSKPKDLNVVDYEKNCQECTFHPDLKKADNITLQKVYAKNIDKFITRMRNSQKEREYVNQWTNSAERGNPGKRRFEETVQESHFGKEFEEKMSIFRESSIKETTTNPEQNDHEHNFNENLERVPLLFVDVNIGPNRTERIIVNEGDRSEDLAEKFALEFR